MNSSFRNIAVVLAAGSGTRFNSELPKQFLKIGDKTVVEYSVDAFEKNQFIDEVAIVVHSGFLHIIEEIMRKRQWKKVKKLIPGGAERHLSTFAAISAFSERKNVNLIFHDAARPLISQQIINRVVEELRVFEAVAVALPATDTVFKAYGDFVGEIPDRKSLWCAQTPQAFRIKIISEAYQKALNDSNFGCTDDCGVILKYHSDVEIKIVPGDPSNIKITYPNDLLTVSQMLPFD